MSIMYQIIFHTPIIIVFNPLKIQTIIRIVICFYSKLSANKILTVIPIRLRFLFTLRGRLTLVITHVAYPETLDHTVIMICDYGLFTAII